MQQDALEREQEPYRSILMTMRQAGLSELIQTSFLNAVASVKRGEDGLIAEASIRPVQRLSDVETLPDLSVEGSAAMPHTAIIKLNGGLGTSMGLAQAKSLLPVKNGETFLGLIVRQVMHLRKEYKTAIPLIFMNSFRTEADTLEKLKAVGGLQRGQGGIPFSFLQNKVPKLRAADFLPVVYPLDPSLEWCPPGHGDIYVALKQSHILKHLIDADFRYAFVSNADNLGADLNNNLLGYFAKSNAPFMMEVADRTTADKKGGHLALDGASGKLLLREVAQTAAADIEQFQDINRHRYFNTNSIWLNLLALDDILSTPEGVMDLPIIVNHKNVNPSDVHSDSVVQLESAMGAAISVFSQSQAIRVPRSRFLPVKKTDDLLLLMSDLYQLSDAGTLHRTSEKPLPKIQLDSEYFGHIDDFLQRFAAGVPSLKQCTSLTIEGDVHFGANVTLIGDVTLNAPYEHTRYIERDAVIER